MSGLRDFLKVYWPLVVVAFAGVRRGDVVAEIVPSDSDLVAEVRVSPRDIGHVDVGDEEL